jgi:protease I
MPQSITGKSVAILATDGVEERELAQPMEAIKNAGAQVTLVSIKSGEIQGTIHGEKTKTFKVDKLVSDVSADQFDALVLPGGVGNPDKLRADAKAVQFVKDFFAQKKPVAAICHGPWLLAEADVLRGRKITSYGSIKTDMKNAGANWVDEEVVVDKGLVTSRKPEDLEAFCRKTIEEIAEGRHDRKAA